MQESDKHRYHQSLCIDFCIDSDILIITITLSISKQQSLIFNLDPVNWHAADTNLDAADMRTIFSIVQEHAHSFCHFISHPPISFISQSSDFKFAITNRLLVNCSISKSTTNDPIKNLQARPYSYAVITFSKWPIIVLFWCVLMACLMSSSQAAIILHRLNSSSVGLTLHYKQVSDSSHFLSINLNARSVQRKLNNVKWSTEQKSIKIISTVKNIGLN